MLDVRFSFRNTVSTLIIYPSLIVLKLVQHSIVFWFRGDAVTTPDSEGRSQILFIAYVTEFLVVLSPLKRIHLYLPRKPDYSRPTF